MKLRRYIEHAFNCQSTQTKKHRLYGKLMFIIFPPQLFHIITIDFFFALFGKLNALFNIIDKFIRKIAFIANKSIYNVDQWVNALLNRLFIADWGIPTIIISDRKPQIFLRYVANIFRANGDQITYFYGLSPANRWNFKTYQRDGGNNYPNPHDELSKYQFRFNFSIFANAIQ